MKNYELSKRYRKYARREKQCFRNAWIVCERLQADGMPAQYVEGYTVNGPVLEHGWVELGGEIIDVTLPEQVLDYFPAHRYIDLDAAQAIPNDSGMWLPIFYRFGWGGSDSKSMITAQMAAYERFYAMYGLTGTNAPTVLTTLQHQIDLASLP